MLVTPTVFPTRAAIPAPALIIIPFLIGISDTVGVWLVEFGVGGLVGKVLEALASMFLSEVAIDSNISRLLSEFFLN